MYKHRFPGNKYIGWSIMLLSWVALCWQSYEIGARNLSHEAIGFLLFFSVLNVILLTTNRLFERIIPFRLNFLLTTFTMLIAWRLSVLANFDHVSQVYLAALFLKLLNFSLAAYYDIKQSRSVSAHCTTKSNVGFEWQLTFIRIFIGFDLVPHFCEKLFAGASVRAADIQAFVSLDIPYPLYFVIVAGVFEFFGSLAISCGILTRLGSLCLCAYLITSTYLGHHFQGGFIWASPGGGWEFPVLWTTLILSFSIFGADEFSFDAYFANKLKLPKIILWSMGRSITKK